MSSSLFFPTGANINGELDFFFFECFQRWVESFNLKFSAVNVKGVLKKQPAVGNMPADEV